MGFAPGGRRLACLRREARLSFSDPNPAMLRRAPWPRLPPRPRSFFPLCCHFPASPVSPDWALRIACNLNGFGSKEPRGPKVATAFHPA
jgi:hypothetical protein